MASIFFKYYADVQKSSDSAVKKEFGVPKAAVLKVLETLLLEDLSSSKKKASPVKKTHKKKRKTGKKKVKKAVKKAGKRGRKPGKKSVNKPGRKPGKKPLSKRKSKKGRKALIVRQPIAPKIEIS